MVAEVVAREVRLQRPVDLWGTLGPLSFGADPSWRRLSQGYAKASLTPLGRGLEVVTVQAKRGVVSGEFFGPGAGWLAERLEDLLGVHDDVTGFEPPAVLESVWRRRPGLRVPRSRLVLESLVPVVLGQKVTGVEALASYRRLVTRYGSPVGVGPFSDLVVPPSGRDWGSIPTWEWHTAGVGPQRMHTIIAAVSRADALERLVDLPLAHARRALASLPGVGAWTVAEVAHRALGDADAVSVGDFHVGRNVVYALSGRTDGDDAEMIELLGPYAGHRHRVQRLTELAGIAVPRRGPRYRGHDFRRM